VELAAGATSPGASQKKTPKPPKKQKLEKKYAQVLNNGCGDTIATTFGPQISNKDIISHTEILRINSSLKFVKSSKDPAAFG
jgi:hypothetical protein